MPKGRHSATWGVGQLADRVTPRVRRALLEPCAPYKPVRPRTDTKDHTLGKNVDMTVDGDEVMDELSVSSFAESLTALRLKAGLSVRDLSRRTGIPSGTLGGYFSGRHLPPANRPEVLDSILSACGVDAQDRQAWRQRLVELHRARRAVTVQRAPYRGLAGFGVEDHELFFGRNQLVDELRNRLEEIGHGVVVVVGPSGTGKSSLLRAGLIPALRHESAGDRWGYEIITPGDDPTSTVDAAIGRLENLRDRARLLVVDQFEELFTLTEDEDVQAAAVRRLVGWAESTTSAEPRALLVGLRADHFGDVAARPELVAALRHNQVLVPPMTDDQLRAAIEGPAGEVGLKLEWGLSDVILADIRGSDVIHILPHLAHTLEAMWEVSDRKLLRIKDYKTVGGVAGAVRRSAEQAFEFLDPEQQEVARTLLLQLIALAPDAGPSRRSRSRQVLASFHSAAPEVLDYLIAHRLVTASEKDVSLSHEALITAWPRLHHWLDEDRSDLLLRGLLGRQERTWRDHDRDPDLLLQGSLLATVREWSEAHEAELTDVEREYIRASELRADARDRERRRQHRRTQQLLAMALAFAMLTVLAGAAALQSRSTAAGQRDEARSRQLARVAATLRENNIPLANQVALRAFEIAQTRESRSALVDATSLPVLTRRLDPGAPRAVAADNAGSFLAFGGSDGRVDLVAYDSEKLIDVSSVTLDEEGSSVQSVALAHDGHLLGVAGDSPHVRLYDTSAAHDPVVLADLPVDRTVFDLSFTPDGHYLLAALDADDDGAGAILLWERVGDNWVARDPYVDVEGSARGLTVADDGRRVAAATMSGHLYLWTLGPQGLVLNDIAEVGDDQTRQFDVALSPGASHLAAAGSDRVVRLFPVEPDDALGEPIELDGFGSWVNAVSFTPDGAQVVAGASDSTLRVWDMPRGDAGPTLRTVLPVSAAVTSVGAIGDDRTVFTTTDTSSYVWHRTRGILPLHQDTIFVTRSSADGTRTITTPGTEDGAVHVWDTSTPREPALLSSLRAPKEMGVLDGAGGISRSGTIVVAGTSTGFVVSWDITDPRSPRLLGGARVGDSYIDYIDLFDNDRTVVAASNDGRLGTIALTEPNRVREVIDLPDPALSAVGSSRHLIATGGTQGGVNLWDGYDLVGGPLARLDIDLAVFALDFNATDTVLAAGGANNQVQLFDVSDPTAPVSATPALRGPAATVYSVQFSPHDGRLAAATLDGTVWVWRTEDEGYRSELVLQSPPAPLNAVGWINDRHLIAGGHEGRAHLWVIAPDAAAEIVCTSTGSPATELEWTTHLPGIDYTPPCGQETR